MYFILYVVMLCYIMCHNPLNISPKIATRLAELLLSLRRRPNQAGGDALTTSVIEIRKLRLQNLGKGISAVEFGNLSLPGVGRSSHVIPMRRGSPPPLRKVRGVRRLVLELCPTKAQWQAERTLATSARKKLWAEFKWWAMFLGWGGVGH